MLFWPGVMSSGTSKCSRFAPSGTVSAITCVAGVTTGTVGLALPFGAWVAVVLPPLPLQAERARAATASKASAGFQAGNRILRRLTERLIAGLRPPDQARRVETGASRGTSFVSL